MAVRVCAEPGCPELTVETYCTVHKPEPWSTSSRRSRLPRGWSTRIVPRILRRDPVCRICHLSPSVEVDHIVNNDDHSDENLQGACKPCHQAKTQREAAKGRRR